MPSGYRRPSSTRARRQALQRRRMLALGGALLIIFVLILIVVLISGKKRSAAPAVAATATPSPTAAPELFAQQEEPTPTPAPTSTPTPAPTEIPSARALTRPTPTAEGFIPVFYEAKTEEKIIAITVDDCFQADNLQQIIDAAMAVGGKLTLFPIGQQAIRDKQAAILKSAWENGFELENHTYTHNTLYWCDDDRLTYELFKQQMALSYVLGVNYQCHFVRPGGGDDRDDQRLQVYADQLGYYGIAHWSCAGSVSSDKQIINALKPGAIYLFHTTNNDLDKLLRFIPWAASKGYQLVTLNEMFDYPANETSPMTMKPNEVPVPTLAPFERILVPYKKPSYSSGVRILQEKLIELNYLEEGTADGVYGSMSEAAISAYQRDHGLEVDGRASVALQEMIFADTQVRAETAVTAAPTAEAPVE